MNSLRVSIQSFYESPDSVTFYTILVVHLGTSISWICNRKLSEFHGLHRALSEKYKIPLDPPGYTTFSSVKFMFKSIIPALDTYLNSILALPDIYICEEIPIFFCMSLHLSADEPVVSLINEFGTKYKTEFISMDQNAVFTSDSDPSVVHRMEQYIKYIGYLGSDISTVNCIYEDSIWEISLTDKVTWIEWCFELTVLAVGLDHGLVIYYLVKTEENYSNCEEYLRNDLHYGAVSNIKIDPMTSKVFTCGKDARLLLTTLTDNKLIESQLNFPPVSMELYLKQGLVYVATPAEIILFDVETLLQLRTGKIQMQGGITAMALSHNGQILIGGSLGDVILLNNYFEVIWKKTMAIEVTCVNYWEHEYKQILIAGDKHGIVSLWNVDGDAIFKYKAHESCICIKGNSKKLVTSGSEKLVKMWRFSG